MNDSHAHAPDSGLDDGTGFGYLSGAGYFHDDANGFGVDGAFVDLATLPVNFLPDSGVAYRSPDFSLSDVEGLFTPSSTDVSSVGGGTPDQASLADGSSPSGGGVPLSPSNFDNSSDPVVKYITDMLMEENVEDQPWVLPDKTTLRLTERSLYDALGEPYPESPAQTPPFDISQFIMSPKSNYGSSSDYGSNSSADNGTNTSDSTGLNWVYESETNYNIARHMPNPGDVVSLTDIDTKPVNIVPELGNASVDFSKYEQFVRNMLSDNDSINQFNKGLEEASKFLPNSDLTQLNFLKNDTSSKVKRTRESGIDGEKDAGEHVSSGFTGWKNHDGDDVIPEEGRANKQTALYDEEEEEEDISEMLDRVLLGVGRNGEAVCLTARFPGMAENKNVEKKEPVRGRRGRGRKGEKGVADLRPLLILCAQAVSSNDFRTAQELLKQIRQESSPYGDGSQRLAHYFANGLEARLVGRGVSNLGTFATLMTKKRSVADKLKAYQLHISSCPFKKFPILFANTMIKQLGENAKVIHIIDFGIGYGFQWPILIQGLAKRAEGPPLLRMTGIELPRTGPRPAETIEQTGRRLERYCQRFEVPFEFNALASQHWETIRVEDLKLRNDEFLAVNCNSRFRNLYDETVDVNCPRDAVLRLISSMKPNVFVHSVSNGAYNAPFFVTRFREALFHISAVYDMFDATIPRDNQQRVDLESEFYGYEVMNVIACEGAERVERPETYKQWQVRHARAGLKQLPLDKEIVALGRDKLENHYHKDFVLDEDNKWLLLGWRGRIMYASSCWAPA
ncbi:hypothetical protein MLD38_009653 [Melastoma candidum]|nr:hypothetical protein MLD38_009653 [Melastoma candidum]